MDTVYVKDTILITKKVRVPYRATKKDTVYCPIVFVFSRSELRIRRPQPLTIV